MITIDKNNLNYIDKDDLCFHDLLINVFDFNLEDHVLTIKLSDYDENKFVLEFIKVVAFSFCEPDIVRTLNRNALFGWEEIPNEFTKDFFIEEIKHKFLEQGGQWNNDSFAVRFLFVNMDEIKIICESIKITKIMG